MLIQGCGDPSMTDISEKIVKVEPLMENIPQ